jgi:Rhodanese-like domain
MLGFGGVFGNRQEDPLPMRHIATAAVFVLAALTASAQYKNPSATPSPSPTIQSSNPAIQITPGVMPTPAVEAPLESARRIPRPEAIKMMKAKKAVWIDVRPRDQFDQGHIPGAINIPLSDLPARWSDLPVKKFLITYCA